MSGFAYRALKPAIIPDSIHVPVAGGGRREFCAQGSLRFLSYQQVAVLTAPPASSAV
jgi:hypothetical protein